MHSVNFIFRACGFAVYRLDKSLGKGSFFIHTPDLREHGAVQKSAGFTVVFKQLLAVLYTTFVQYYAMFISVNRTVVHNFHRAYKYNYKLNNKYINLTKHGRFCPSTNYTKGLAR